MKLCSYHRFEQSKLQVASLWDGEAHRVVRREGDLMGDEEFIEWAKLQLEAEEDGQKDL